MQCLTRLTLIPCLLTALTGCVPDPATAPGVLSTDPAPLVITADTYDLTFFGLNFAPDAYLAVYGTTFTTFCDGSEYYGHTCPYGLYATYSFEDAYEFFASFRRPPYGGLIRIFNVGLDGRNDAGEGDDRPSGIVAFRVE